MFLSLLDVSLCKLLKTIPLETLETPIQHFELKLFIWPQTILWRNPKPNHINFFCILNYVTSLTQTLPRRLFTLVCFNLFWVCWIACLLDAPFYYIVWNGEQLLTWTRVCEKRQLLQASDFIKHLLFYSIAYLVF